MDNQTNIFSLKWGTKYGPEYVNKLYAGLKRYITIPFTYTCVTDDPTGLDPDIKIVDYATFDPFDYPKDRIFTREKLVMFDKFTEGRCAWIDLDALIHKDITFLFEQDLKRPKFIWNYWNNYEERSLQTYGKGTACHVNSSFVMWHGDNGKYLYNLLKDNEERAFFTYKSLDKFLFYQAHRRGLMDFWPEGIVSNFNREAFQQKGYISIFNTSHLYNNKGLTEKAYELHEAAELSSWVRDNWIN